MQAWLARAEHARVGPIHGGNTGSNPVGDATSNPFEINELRRRAASICLAKSAHGERMGKNPCLESPINTPAVATAATAVREALVLLSRASSDWRNGNPEATGPLHWPVAVPAAWRALSRALQALEEINTPLVLRATTATSATSRVEAGAPQS
jgi:hypothetical protein